jgi:hypothetical protein
MAERNAHVSEHCVPRDERGDEVAFIHDASPESVVLVLGACEGDDEGRSSWQWLRLPNGDLMLGVFPRGATYEAVERDAAFPGW